MSFSSFGLCDSVLQGVRASGYTSPTEIQKQAIPLALAGNDIVGCAPTGTGKTAAFVLPILHRIETSGDERRSRRSPRALVLTPTRELAQQIQDCVETYGFATKRRCTSVYGGVPIAGQLNALRQGTDIVVATPGRLIDHLQRHSIDLRQVEILVLDEADRMYDMGFVQAVRSIVAQTPKNRQTLLFSATMPNHIRTLTAEILRKPHKIDIGARTSPVETVTQFFYSVPQKAKTGLLVHMLNNEPVDSMLVFSRTKRGADRITRQLDKSGIRSEAIHSNRSQSQRQRALNGFKQRRFRVLVATDIAARGIDVDGITHVVNYDTPAFAEDYIHRIGRTGRAEALGTAVTFVSNDEENLVRKISHFTGKRCVPARYPGYNHPDVPISAQPTPPPSPWRRSNRTYRRPVRFV